MDWYAGSAPPTDSSDWKLATAWPSPLATTATSYEFTGTYGDHTVVDGTTYQLRIRAISVNSNDNNDHLPSEWVIVAGTPPSGSSQSSDARLSALTASSSTSMGGTFQALSIGTFASATTSYAATVANSINHVKLTPTVNHASATVTVGGTAVTSGTASSAIALSVGANTITVQVTAQDSTTKDYTVTITRQQQQIQSSDANLSNLAASSSTSMGGTFQALSIGTFASATTSYAATVANSINHVKLTPTVNHASATVTVGGTAVTSGTASSAIALSVGANTITVQVTAQDSTTKDYTVTITRQQQQIQSSDANLSNLAASSSTSMGGTFQALSIGTFASATTSYAATVANSITHVKLTPTVNHASATVTVGGTAVTSGTASTAIGLSVGANAITVQVTAQDSTTKDYTVTITREAQQTQSSDANLSALTASSSTSMGGTFQALSIGTFASATTSYAATVANSITHVKLTPTVNHASATVTVGGTAVTSGTASTAIGLSVGANTITVQVTAQDSTTKDYTVTITRQRQDDTPPPPPTPPTPTPPTGGGPTPEGPSDSALSGDASLSALEIKEASLDFDPDTYDYTVTVYGETLTLTPTANHPDAEITVNTYPVQSGAPATFTP